MICKKCGTEIADKALICYRCGTATSEPRITPPASMRSAAPGRSIVPAVVLLVVLLLAALALPYAERYGIPRVVIWAIIGVDVLAVAWTLLRRQARR